MSRRIHYYDNLFFLTEMIRVLKRTLSRNIDADYFKEKIIEDILFIDSSLERIYISLRENSYLINRIRYLQEIMKVKKQFIGFTSKIINKEIKFAEHIENIFKKLEISKKEHKKDVKEIEATLNANNKNPDAKEIISSEEFKFLFMNIDDSEERK